MFSKLVIFMGLWAILSTCVFLIQVLWIYYSTPLTPEGVSKSIEALIKLLVDEVASPRAVISALVGAILSVILSVILKLFEGED